MIIVKIYNRSITKQHDKQSMNFARQPDFFCSGEFFGSCGIVTDLGCGGISIGHL
jgi:hypothetical protein